MAASFCLYRVVAMIGPTMDAIPRLIPKQQNMRLDICEFVPAEFNTGQISQGQSDSEQE